MATIDSNIAMGYRPVQIENPLNQLAAMTQIQSGQQGQQLNALQMRKAQQEFDTQNALAEAYKGAFNPDTGVLDYSLLTKRLAEGGAGSAIPGVIKYRTEADQAAELLSKTKIDAEKSVQALTSQMQRDLSRDPSDLNIQKNFDVFVSSGLFKPHQIAAAQAKRDQLLAMPFPNRQPFLSSIGATAGELKPVIQNMDVGGSIIPRVLDAYSGLPISEQKPILKTPTFADITSQGNLNVSQQRLAAELNPDIQGNLAAAKKRAEENVKFETQGRIDIAANRKALKQAGYDPVTGTDDITKLIKESTGGYLGKGLDIGARVFGSATEGSKALAQLEQKGNAITFGLLNGKLGAGISTSDRQFIEALVSRISDGTLPVEDRLAAWTSAKDMMRTLGMVEPPTKSGATKPSAAPSNQTKSGATVSNW